MSEKTFGNVMFILLYIATICLGITCYKINNLRKQAIERGHAEYVVDSGGEKTWQWKEKQ